MTLVLAWSIMAAATPRSHSSCSRVIFFFAIKHLVFRTLPAVGLAVVLTPALLVGCVRRLRRVPANVQVVGEGVTTNDTRQREPRLLLDAVGQGLLRGIAGGLLLVADAVLAAVRAMP